MAVRAKSAKAKAAKKGTRKSTMVRKRQKSARLSLILLWARRGLAIAFFFAIIGWCAVWFVGSGANASIAHWVRSKTLSVTADAGFRVKEILVEGRVHSDVDVLLGIVNVREGDPLFALKPKEAKEQIEKITWVKSARVERRLPDSIYVHLVERKPIALWQNDGALSVVDETGSLLTQQDLASFKDLVMVNGDDAPKYVGAFLMMLNAEDELLSRIDHASLIDSRRWDLHLKDGKTIKLPEENTALAMRNIVIKHQQDNILGEDAIADIDARYQGRLIVRTKLGKVQDYRAATSAVGTAL